MKGRLISQVGRLILVTQKNFLGSLGIELTDKEKEKLLKTLPIDAAGKVYQNGLLKGMKSLSANGMIGLKEVMDGVKATTGVVVDVKYVKTILKNMGIEFTDKEHLKLMKNLPFNEMQREREAETQAEGEAGSMQRARRGTRSRDSRIMPWAAGSAKPLRHRGCPRNLSKRLVCYVCYGYQNIKDNPEKGNYIPI
ncbi:uncharacterized protein AAEQ78_013124 isoform 1-T2 [Lycaon pictus]